MSIERAIFERWRTCAPLVALVPAERFFVGVARSEPELPYVVLEPRKTKLLARTSSRSQFEDRTLRFGVWAESLELARRISEALRARFNRSAFPLVRGSCLCMQQVGYQWVSEADGTWHVMSDYRCTIEQQVGD